jgi:hypothetical protein
MSTFKNRDKYVKKKRRNIIKTNEIKSTNLSDGIKLVNYSLERMNSLSTTSNSSQLYLQSQEETSSKR